MLKSSYCENSNANTNANGVADAIFEIGVDEAGRGPMLGRVYTAAVILSPSFNHALMKDSKKFHSEKKIRAAADYIKANAVAWAIAYSSEQIIDDVNIRNATHKAMHAAIKHVLADDIALPSDANNAICSANNAICSSYKSITNKEKEILLLVDGNDFTPYMRNNTRISHVCIEGGDNTYSSIAAASILAKVSRDDYIAELCKEEPLLIERYDLLKNKGYGTKKHMDGIKTHGISAFHRKTFGICRNFA